LRVRDRAASGWTDFGTDLCLRGEVWQTLSRACGIACRQRANQQIAGIDVGNAWVIGSNRTVGICRALHHQPRTFQYSLLYSHLRHKGPENDAEKSVYLCVNCNAGKKTHLQPETNGWWLACIEHGKIPSDKPPERRDMTVTMDSTRRRSDFWP
jgi:hypothetical protein